MSLKTHAKALSGSAQTIFTVPQGAEGTAHNILCTGTGDLTLQYFHAATGDTHTIFSGKTVTDEIALEKSFNFESGDKLIASGAGLTIFASIYYVGSNASTAVLPYGPGPQELVAGDMNAGYFGEVPASELYSGDRLAFELAVTEGVLQNSDAGWLKFARDGKVLFIAKQTFMHSVTWDHLYARGIVYGTDDDGKAPRGTPVNQRTVVEHGGNKFVVRLMTGAVADPFPESDSLFFTDDMYQMDIGGGSEWNDLMYRVCTDVPSDPSVDGMAADRHGGPQIGDNWASFPASSLNIGSGNGRNTWCQEQSDSSSTLRVNRGVGGVAGFGRSGAYGTFSYLGWRPVLELIPSH